MLIDTAVEIKVVVTTEQKNAMTIIKELLIINRSGWVHTWDYLMIEDFSVDRDDNIYCMGLFTDVIDLDPNVEIDEHISIGGYDIFLVKLSSEGDFQWGCSWGGEFDDEPCNMAVCDSGIYVTGYFKDIVDFDPGGGSNLHISNGFLDGFLSKFDLDGEYLWTCTWGSEEGYEIAGGVDVDNGDNVYVTMNLPYTFDLDPGAGVDIRVLKGYEDGALIKLDQDGNYLWAKTWGGSNAGTSVRKCRVNNAGEINVSGYLSGKADFDPGPAVDEHSGHESHYYLSKFDQYGNYQKVILGDVFNANSIDTDLNNNIYLAGTFHSTFDLDPGPGSDIRNPEGQYDGYIVKLSYSGDYIWGFTLGAMNANTSYSFCEVDIMGNIYVAGSFGETVDFDPSPGIARLTSIGQSDAFLSKYDIDGGFQWARHWGGEGIIGGGFLVTADVDGYAYVTGSFAGTADFDPGPEVYECNTTVGFYLTKFPPDGEW